MGLRQGVASALLLALALAAGAGCQCAKLRDDLVFLCEGAVDCPGQRCVEGECVDPPASDGGVDAGSDGGVDGGAGQDGGEDGGVDAGPVPCNDWDCVLAGWGAPSPVTSAIGIRSFPVPAGVDGGLYAYFGGVLVPDGRVIAVAHTADWMLRIDPVALTAELFGPHLPNQRENERKWAGGVLGPDGMVYLFPYERTRLLQVDPRDGGAREVGPKLAGSASGYVGGVVDRHGFIWSVSESYLSHPVVRYDPVADQLATFDSPDGGPWGGWWGMSRLPDDRLVAFPKEAVNAPSALSPYILLITPGAGLHEASFVELTELSAVDAGLALQGSALTREGRVWAPSAGPDPRVLGLVPDGGLTVVDTGHYGGFGFVGTFGDGLVWTTPDNTAGTLALWRFAGDGGASRLSSSVVAPRYGFLGLVATPKGLLCIPGTIDEVLLLQPGAEQPGGLYDVRPMSVLLSPYFNKL